MTRVASAISDALFIRSNVDKESFWWSVSDFCTVLESPQIRFSPLIPDGSIITEVKVQSAPYAIDTLYESRIRLKIVESDQISEAQIIQSESVIKWWWHEAEYGWTNLGLVHDDIWPCHKTLHGAHMRLAVVVNITGEGNMLWRVSVQYRFK